MHTNILKFFEDFQLKTQCKKWSTSKLLMRHGSRLGSSIAHINMQNHGSLNRNSRKSRIRTKVWTRTDESLDMNGRKSGHQRTKVWAWRHENLINARKSCERSKFWKSTH